MGSDGQPSLFDLRTGDRFEPSRLHQARVLAGLTKTEVASSVGVSAAAVGQYEAGVNSPRADVLARLAKALRVEPGFFSFGRPLVPLSSVHGHFRSLRTARVKDRQKALATASMIWELTFALERYVKLPAPSLPVIDQGASPAEAAAALRRHWALPEGPIKHLVATAEAHGIVVAVRPLAEIESVDAFSVVIMNRPIIMATPRQTENVFRHRFSVAHELGHLILHDSDSEASVKKENEADEFAAAFLTPASAMDAILPSRLDLAALDRIGRQWGVSVQSLMRRMVERGRTTESSLRRAYQRLALATTADSDPARVYPGEMPSLLKKAAELSADYGAGVPVLADMLKLSSAQVRDLLGVEDSRPVLRLVDSE